MCIAAVKYDPGKEEKEEREKKQRKLKEIEEARKKDASNARQFGALPWLLIIIMSTAAADSPASDPGFVEKLITQIIRNVQVSGQLNSTLLV